MTMNYDRVCRLCLSSRGELLPIFPTTSSDESEPPVIASKIKDCVSVQITKNDELPLKVCKKCMDNVNNWHIFKSVCEKSQNKLLSLKESSQLEELNIKSEPLSDEAYDDGVVIDGSYPEQNAANKIQPEGPPILASLGLTPRSDKGAESEKEDFAEEDNDEEELPANEPAPKVPNMPEVSITVMRPTGETLQSRQGIQQIASKDCLICGRSYRYSHNARRHELGAHNFDRYTNKVTKKTTNTNSMPMMQPKLRPNPFNPKARLMPNPISHKMQFMNLNKPMQTRLSKAVTPPKPIPIRAPKPIQNNLPYPLRIKALKDLQIKKKEPQILKTLLTSKPEMLIAEPEILNSAPESPETLTSEPDIASFQVEAVLEEPEDGYDPQGDEEMDGEPQNSQLYDTVDGEMDSENEIEIARQQTNEEDAEGEHNPDNMGEHNEDQVDITEDDPIENNIDNQNDTEDQHDYEEAGENHNENFTEEQDEDKFENENKEEHYDNGENYEEREGHENQENNEDDDDLPLLEPQIQLTDEPQEENLLNNETSHVNEDEELDESGEVTNALDTEVKELDPDKVYVTKTQRDFIQKYRDVIQQINTKTCLCCNKEYPRRKAVIQHLQKYGQKVPKHTCYNCVVTFGHIGALLSHMRANVCTDLWKIIFNEEGITDDMVIEDEPPVNKAQYKELLSARSYSCKLCPAKFQLKQFIQKHVLDVHEDGQSTVQMFCVHCKARFKDRSLWKKHVRNGDCVIYISCDICFEKFGTLQDFNNHAMAVHAETFDPESQTKCVDVRPTDCPICGKKNGTYQNLIKHMKAIHDEDKPHYCQHCDSKFEQAVDLNKHIYDAHSDKSGVEIAEPDMSIVKEEAEEYHYSCTECNAIFETVDAWTDHQVAEHNQIAHHCDQCDKKFLRPSELAEHKNTHLRVKFYACSLCSNSYGSTQKLADHVQKAHGGATYANAETEFYCDICVRSFKSRQAYSNHMRIHSKVPTTNRKPQLDKSFAPQVIGKPIKQIPFQSSYIAMKPNCIVPNAPYSCDICGKGFMHKKNIWKHKKVLHADVVQDRNDSEENTMQGSTEEEEYNPDENTLSTPQFNSFNFSSVVNNVVPPPQPQQEMHSCDLCYKKFPLRSSLWKHKRAKHGIINPSSTEPQMSGGAIAIGGGYGPAGGGRASCTICKITFSDKKSYYRHRKNVHKTSVQMCKICGKPLSSTLELYEHLKAAHARELLGYNANQGSSKVQDISPEEPEYDEPEMDPNADYQARYPCDTCGKQFVGLLALQNHQCVNQVSSQPQSFDCEICHKSYSSISALKSHRGWHLRSPDGKAAANNSGLWMPQNKVTNKVSKHEILDASQLAKVTHSTPLPTSSKRRLPPEVEVTIVNPNKKMRSDDSEIDQLNSGQDDKYCNICDREFTKRAAYYRHMDEVHQPNSVFCPVCNKSFTRKSTLLVHMKKHYEGGEGSSSIKMEDEEFACDVCGAQYMNERALKEHRVRQHGEMEDSEGEMEGEEEEDEGMGMSSLGGSAPPGEFTCGQCGQGVATPRDLILHRNIHSTPTKFFCIICKVYFSRAIDLSAHTRDRHSDNDKVYFPCAMCDRFYMNKKSLQRHIEMAH